MRRCERCPGFIPQAASACPNCDAPSERPWWCSPAATRGALAGTAAMTLMACYGAPVNWILSESDAGESILLDADNATAEGNVEFTVSQDALSELSSELAEVSLTLTPLAADTAFTLESTINGSTTEESYTISEEPVSIVLPADSFSECTDDVCTQTISFSIELVSGRAVFEGSARIEIYGADQSIPTNAEASVTWTP
ncbi:MAG: hypothetical protein ACE37F_13925 [Nannocystaceae bacterium]|nr:hypothetical protein [bacterium]